jgi:hypothetical protein
MDLTLPGYAYPTCLTGPLFAADHRLLTKPCPPPHLLSFLERKTTSYFGVTAKVPYYEV